MKFKLKLFLIIALMIIVLAACGKNGKQEGYANSKPIDTTDRINIEADPITINSLSEEEIKAMINAYDNYKIADNFYINIPESAPVLEFVSRETEDEYGDFDKVYKDFLEIYDYLLPEHEMDESYLEFMTENPNFDPDGGDPALHIWLPLMEHYDELTSDEIKAMVLYYNEEDTDGGVYLECSPHITWGSVSMNKNLVAEMGLNEEAFELIGIYSPNSTESFKFTDKELAINDAVSFFENYVNNIPYSEDTNLDTVVSEVWVYKVSDDDYGYYFNTTSKNHGIIYDYDPRYDDYYAGDDNFYITYSGVGFMIESKDVAYFQANGRKKYMDDVQKYDSVLPFEDALKIINDSLTKAVEFEVLRVEFVYTSKSFIGDDGFTQIEDGRPCTVLPCWKLILHNENDDKYYNCYVNAKDGVFRYWSYSVSIPE